MFLDGFIINQKYRLLFQIASSLLRNLVQKISEILQFLFYPNSQIFEFFFKNSFSLGIFLLGRLAVPGVNFLPRAPLRSPPGQNTPK